MLKEKQFNPEKSHSKYIKIISMVIIIFGYFLQYLEVHVTKQSKGKLRLKRNEKKIIQRLEKQSSK